MKKFLLLLLMVVFIFASTTLYAAEKYSLGNSNVALKVDWISFTEDVFDKVDLENGIYLGLEGYYAVYPNLYLGMEAGWGGAENDKKITIFDERVKVKTNINFVPIELNLKYAIEASPQWIISLGAGVSYSWFDVQLDVGSQDADNDDWVFGGQVFADVTYKMNKEWFIGINGKYQFTEDLEFKVKGKDIDTDTSADNFRIGAQIGMMF